MRGVIHDGVREVIEWPWWCWFCGLNLCSLCTHGTGGEHTGTTHGGLGTFPHGAEE